MKRFLACVAGAFLLFSSALADPLPLAEDLADTIIIFYNGEDASDGRYVYSYCYPQVVPEHADAYLVNPYFEYLVKDTRDYTVPNLSDYYAAVCMDVQVDISYEITCNNDDFFSVLIRKTENIDGDIIETWQGSTFSRLNGMPGSVCSLPNILGILDPGESDDWLEDRQARKVCEVVRDLVWEAILENPGQIPYDAGMPKDDLELVFDPELDFWLDGTGNPVFFILPGRIADAGAGLLTFPISLEAIRDEM